MSAAKSRRNRFAKFLRISDRRKLRRTEQVAAVCYKIGRHGIEFLLVQTRSGRWTFPKGGVEPGLTHAEAAAMEAFEEAGVHGRIEHVSFARYVRRKRRAGTEAVVHAHLCEVFRLERPQESNRKPTWFSPEKAKQRLQENRKNGSATELACVVERALARIQHLFAGTRTRDDELQKVRFEAVDNARAYSRLLEASFARLIRREHGEVQRSSAISLAVGTHLSEFLRLGPPQNAKLLPAGEEKRNVSPAGAPRGVPQEDQFIDGSRTSTDSAKIPRKSSRRR